jgi:hypothetical protein
LLEEINRAYEDLPDASEQMVLGKMRNQQRKLVEDQW